MLFNSLEFLLFFPVVFFAYWVLKSNLRAQNVLILVSSYFFYGWWDWRFLSLIFLSSVIDFTLGQQIQKSNGQKKRKLLLGVSLLFNLGILGVFKYYNFFLGEFDSLLGSYGYECSWTTLNIVLPVGISFYTFQTLSYTIDVYKKKIEASTDAIQFFSFVAFFPQLVAGPIERATNLLPQFSKRRKFDFEEAKDASRQIFWGFFKKVAIADVCAVFIDEAFVSYADTSSPVLIICAILFSIQIYCDFSGYSDIAIGIAKLLGFSLMKNFSMPYFSRDIPEFWRKWHISLSTWFRDYLYIPLGGSRVAFPRMVFNTFAIFLVSGIWHGANWTFIFWGLLHALLFLPKLLSGKNRQYLTYVAEGKTLPNLKEFIQMLSTFIIVTVAWIFFRADSIGSAFAYIEGIFLNGGGLGKFISPKDPDDLILFISLAINISFLVLLEWMNRMNEHGLQKPLGHLIKWPIYLFILHQIAKNFFSGSSFIYFQF